ncbi:MAG: lamin tail domain-containing protein [Elusimicrobia bacterium]|nr:lamin tail domain-containing protein [Candidatus Obscuribacterium magneticum]
MRKTRLYSPGFTLVEVMVASVIMTAVALSMIGVLGNFGKVVAISREVTLATHLAQEKLESLRSQSFYQIMVTSHAVLDTSFSPPLQYDDGYYAPETIHTGGLSFTRKTFIEKTDTPTGVVENVGYPHPDTGLKRISVYVIWQRPDGSLKKMTVSNLAANPSREALDKRIYGTVKNSVTLLPVAGALVQARRNPGWGSYTDTNGTYSFQATDASMILISNRYGYSEFTSAQFNLNYGDNQKDFNMVPITAKTVTGYVITYSGVVISQINGKWHATNDDEYIELYNGSHSDVDLTGYTFVHVDKWDVHNVISMTYLHNTIPALGYFLCLGSQFGTETVAPDGKAADAYYTALISHSQQGGVILKNASGGIVDRVSWGNSVQPPPADAVEETGYDTGGGSPGIDQGKTLVRKAVSTSTAVNMTPPSGIHVNAGNAWDTQNNNSDFVLISTASPRNHSDLRVPQGGTGLAGAVVSADDGISSCTPADASGFFTVSMAVGSWTMSATSTTAMGQKDFTVTAGGPNFVVILATTPPTLGFVTGTVRQYGTTPFPNMLAQADPGGIQAFSDANGIYWLALPAGDEYFITGNPNFYDPDWNTAVTANAISIQAGIIVDTVDLNIWKNAYVSGQITTNGVDGLPGVAVVAAGQYSNGNTAMTDGAGYYTVSGLRLIGNPYDVYPVVLEGQTTSPTKYTVTLAQGENLTGKDFQITGAFVTISGTATYNGAPIPSGVSVIASTTTLSDTNPPDINFALRNGGTKYYQALTDASGAYSLSVVGGKTYNLIAWYTTPTGTTAKTLTLSVASNAGRSDGHFSWP